MNYSVRELRENLRTALDEAAKGSPVTITRYDQTFSIALEDPIDDNICPEHNCDKDVCKLMKHGG